MKRSCGICFSILSSSVVHKWKSSLFTCIMEMEWEEFPKFSTFYLKAIRPYASVFTIHTTYYKFAENFSSLINFLANGGGAAQTRKEPMNVAIPLFSCAPPIHPALLSVFFFFFYLKFSLPVVSLQKLFNQLINAKLVWPRKWRRWYCMGYESQALPSSIPQTKISSSSQYFWGSLKWLG